MSWTFHLGTFVISLLASLAATGLVLGYLRRRAILDHPNERSSHTIPTPRGGGLAVSAVVVTGWAVVSGTPMVLSIVALAAALALLSWIDDLRGLPVAGRFLAQIAAVAGALALMADQGSFFGGLLPEVLDLLAAGLLWVWFVNLFNFMDGIDGLTGVETASLGLGIALVAALSGLGELTQLQGLVIAGAAVGFLWWNWSPAKVFMGDVGSIPLGFMLGWLLLDLAARGAWTAALILPLYYLADATLTLGRRAARGEKVWHAHREHFYQLAVIRGFGHAPVSLAVLMANAALVGLAAAAVLGWRAAALAGACAVVASLLFFLAFASPPSGTRSE